MDYDVAILGGGVIGWSVALNVLRVAPALQVAVFEKEPTFGMGSTGRAAGGVRAQFGTPINVDLSLYSIRQFEELAARGNDIGFKQYGYLFVASTEPTDSYLDAVVGMQQERGVPVRRLTGSEVATIAPYLNCTDIISGSVSWSDGYLDPYAVCQAFERQARELGAKALYSTEILSGAPSRLETARRSFEADVVVIACGHWSSAAASIFGIDLPVKPEKHQLAMTDRAPGLPEALPMVVDLATSFHFRREGSGLLIGFNDPEADMTGSKRRVRLWLP
jgi:sarcosine oxidase, subunit beta